MPSKTAWILALWAAFCTLIPPGRAAGGWGGQSPDERCAASVGEGRSDPDAERIAWARDGRLAWTDFTGKAPAASAEASGSCVGFDVSWECTEDATLTFAVRAVFDRSQSWVRAGSEDNALLDHEQRHFDLTEVFARRLRKRFTELKDSCKNPQGVRQILDAATIDMYREWGLANKKYDEETGRGTEARGQRAWDLRIREELDALKGFEPGR
jgi:hypothetical protein